VVNAGLGGSTITEHRQMIERGLEIEPDLVILQFSENDITDLTGAPMWSVLERNREMKSRLPFSLFYYLVRDSALWQLALRSWVVARAHAEEAPATEQGSSSGGAASVSIESSRREYVQQLRDIQSFLRSRDVPLVYAVYPSHLSVYGLWDSDQLRWLDGVIHELSLNAVSFMPTLVNDGRSETQLYLVPLDGHPSSAGYGVAAQELANSLRAFGLLPDRCG
jgi:lysophospholipase L1-like esterase